MDALTAAALAFLADQPDRAASFERLQDHLSTVPLSPCCSGCVRRPWTVVPDGLVRQALSRLIDRGEVERVRETSRAVVYALTKPAQRHQDGTDQADQGADQAAPR